MDDNGNLTDQEKAKLVIFLRKAKAWWNGGSLSSTDEEILDLIESFEDFRKELDKDP